MRKGVKIYDWFDALDPRSLDNGTMTPGMWLPSLLIWVERLRNIRRDRETTDRHAWDREFLPQNAYLWVPYRLSIRFSRFLSRFSWHPWWGIWDGLVSWVLNRIPEQLTLIWGTDLKGNWSWALFFLSSPAEGTFSALQPFRHCMSAPELITLHVSIPASHPVGLRRILILGNEKTL